MFDDRNFYDKKDFVNQWTNINRAIAEVGAKRWKNASWSTAPVNFLRDYAKFREKTVIEWLNQPIPEKASATPVSPKTEPAEAAKPKEKKDLRDDPQGWFEYIRDKMPSDLRKRELKDWFDEYGTKLGGSPDPKIQSLLADASLLYGQYAEKGDRTEFEVKEVDQARIREAMMKYVGSILDFRSEPENAYKSFVREQLNAMNRWTGRFEDSYEKGLHAEFLARAELAIVANFWDDLATKYSPETDVFKEMTASKIESCRLLSRETYLWFAGYEVDESGKFNKRENQKLKYLENDIDKENPNDLVDEIDRSLKTIKDEIGKGRLSMWTTSDSDRALYLSALAKHLKVNPDAVSLAWQIAVSECWDAKHDPLVICHPLIRLARYSDTRIFKFSKKQPVPGGLRLLVEKMAEKPFLPGDDPEKKYQHVFDREGVSLLRVGYEQLDDGLTALDNMNYLKKIGELYSEQKKGKPGEYKKSKDRLPQSLLMLEITKGAEVYNTTEAIGKTDVKQLGKKELTTIKDKMVALYFKRMTPDRGGSDETFAKAQVMAGIVTAEWAKTILWLPSRANPVNTGQDSAIPTENWVTMFRDIVTDFDGDAQFPFVQEIDREQIKRLYEQSREDKDALIALLNLVGSGEQRKAYSENEEKTETLEDTPEIIKKKRETIEKILKEIRGLSPRQVEDEISKLEKISQDEQKGYTDAILEKEKYKDDKGNDKYDEQTMAASIKGMIYTKRVPFKGYGMCIGFGQANDVARKMAIDYVKYMEEVVHKTEDFLGDKKRSAGLSIEKKKEEQRGLGSFDASYWGNWTYFYGRRPLGAVEKTDRRWWLRKD